MSGEEEKKCPLCVQEMDWTDQQLKPCQCGYQVCVWCWHHLMDMAEKDETEGRCPACRTPYDKDRIVGTVANCERVVVTKKDRKSKPPKVVKPAKPEARKDLSNVRVIQRKMAYIIGLPLSLADEDVLQRKEYFGQYGKVTKVSLSRTAGGAIQQFVNDTCSVYITYSKEEEAIRCIQSVHGFGLDGRVLRASFGTAKYCHAWLRNMPCTNPSCLYLHSIGAEEDSFGKDEEAAVHTRNRVNQIVGAAQNLQRRVGNMLPPPLDNSCNSSSSSTATDKPIVRSTPKDIAQASVTTTNHLSSSLSAGDKDGRSITCNKTFVDVIGQRSSQPERDGNVSEDRKTSNLCSDFSSMTIAKNPHQQHTEYSNSALSAPYGNHPIAVRGDNDSREYSVKPFRESSASVRANFAPSDAYSVKGQCRLMSDSGRQLWPGSRSDAGEDLLYYDDQRLKVSDNQSQGSSVFSSSHPIRFPDSSDGYVQQHRETCSSSDFNGDCSTAYNHYNDASIPFTCVNPLLIDGGNERKFQTSAEPDGNYNGTGNSFSNEEIVEQLRRLDDDTVTNEDDIPALDAVESSIISNILSMDFDSCDESMTLPHNLAGLLDGSSGRHGSWNFRNSDESRFSFAKDDNSANQVSDADSLFSNMGQMPRKYSSVPDSTDNMRGSLHHVVPRAQSSVPPGFSVPSTKAPPGFSTFERPNHLTATSGSYSVKTSLPINQNYAAQSGNNNNSFDFIDPTMLGVDRAKATNTYTYPGLEMRPTSAPEPTAYEDEARRWLMMQQQQSASSTALVQDTTSTPSSHQQKLRTTYGRSDSFSSFGDSYRLSSSSGDQHQNYNNQSSFSQFSQQQKYGNGNGNGNSLISNGYGTTSAATNTSVLDDVESSSSSRNEVVGQRNERLGGLNYYSGYGGDMRLQMPSNGNVYNRVYGL